MSYPLSSSSSGVASNQSGRYTVVPQAIQSVIADHHKLPRGSETVRFQMEVKAADEAYSSGKISRSELTAICRRINDAMGDYQRRRADYDARERAGLTKPSDWFKEFYGCTDEEAEERVRHGQNMENMERANVARNRSRLLHQSRHGRGH